MLFGGQALLLVTVGLSAQRLHGAWYNGAPTHGWSQTHNK